jgi:hypothetical protein
MNSEGNLVTCSGDVVLVIIRNASMVHAAPCW